MSTFGSRVKQLRESRQASDPSFSLRKFAKAVGISPTYLSRLETGHESGTPSEENIRKIAELLGDDPDFLLATAGKISVDLKNIIVNEPVLFASLIRDLRNASKKELTEVVRTVRDGKW